MPASPTPCWTARIWQEFRAGNLTRAARDTLLTLKTYRGRGGLACPSHSTLAERVDCHPVTIWRALQAARALGLVEWTERRVKAAWRSLRSSNRYWLTTPAAPVTPRPKDRPSTSLQKARGGERETKEAAKEGHRGVLAAMLAEAAKGPDLLAMRRQAWAEGLVRVGR